MRFLCLPGAYGSIKNLEVQLAPFVKEVAADGTTSFFYTQGTVPCTPPAGFETYFGPAPHYRFIEFDGIKGNDVLERIRDMPEGRNAEDVLRELLGDDDSEDGIKKGMNDALAAIYRTMDEEGPFDGICAYSEGATVASTLILDEQRRELEEGRPRQIKCAIFFAGWPPLLPGQNQMVLMDDSDITIDVPTLHVVGAGDPYLHGSMALYNVCGEDGARLFDHGKGHIIPRDERTCKELAVSVKEMVQDSQSWVM